MKKIDIPSTPVAVGTDRAWFDPLLFLRNVRPNITTVGPVGGGLMPLAKLNAYRWGIGFILQSGGGFNGRVYPQPSVTNAFGFELSTSTLVWYDMTTLGPFVMSEWYGVFSAGAVLDVWEAIRNPGGR